MRNTILPSAEYTESELTLVSPTDLLTAVNTSQHSTPHRQL